MYSFICECEELNDWRIEVFGRENIGFDWLGRVRADECFIECQKFGMISLSRDGP